MPTGLVLPALAAATLAVAALLILSAVQLARVRRMRKLTRAWEQLDESPEKASPIFEAEARRLQAALARRRGTKRPPDGKSATSCQRACVGLALCSIALGDRESASRAVTAARSQGPLPVDLLARLCEAWLSLATEVLPDSAIQDLLDYVALPRGEQEPKTRETVWNFFRKQMQLGPNATSKQIDAVVELGERLLTVVRDLDWPRYFVGLAHQKARRWSESLRWLEQAVAAAPGDSERHRALAISQWESGAQAAARTSYLTIHRQSREARTAFDAARACYQLAGVPFTNADGREMLGVHPLEQAATLLREATTKAPEEATFWRLRGAVELELEDFDSAQTSYEQSVLLDPACTAGQAMLGRCRLALGDRDGAADALERLREAAADDAAVGHLAGDLAFLAGDYRAALAHFRTVQPPSREAGYRRRLGRCELECGNPQAALELLRSRTDRDPDARLTVGRSYARQGRWSEALEVLEAGDIANPTAEYRYYLATTLAANQRFKRAESLLREVAKYPHWRNRARRQRAHIHLLCNDAAGAERLYQSENGSPPSDFDMGRLALVRGDLDSAGASFDRALSAVGQAESGVGQLQFARGLAAAWQGDAAPLREMSSDAKLGPFVEESLADFEFEQGRYKQAVVLYERAIRERAHVETAVLTRLAASYLHLNRFREALPPLVEITRRCPSESSVLENLALCRYQLGREYYRQNQPDPALHQFARARELLAALGSPLAAVVGQWENEARFRAAVGLLTSPRAAQPPRAADLFEEGEKRAGMDPRWKFGLGTARALQKQFESSAEAFARAAESAPQNASAALGHGLSLEAAGRFSEAQEAFARVLELTSSAGEHDSRRPFLGLAARFALAGSHAKQGQWNQAAQASAALIGHPLIQASSRISDRDVAQTAVASYALAGLHEQATELARKHLQGEPIRDLLIGIVQAEAGDYAGAAQTLTSAVGGENDPAVISLLAGCLLAQAADFVARGQLAQAVPVVEQALKHAPGHKPATELSSALKMALQLENLDLAAIDSAIDECRRALADDSPAQLVRMLGILLHRKSFNAQLKGSEAGPAWKECQEFWHQRILGSPQFWTKFFDEYNAGKTRRESVTSAELDKWRADLPKSLAGDHFDFIAQAIHKRQLQSAQLHLELSAKWAPEAPLEPSILKQAVGDIDDSTADFVEKLWRGMSASAGKKTLGSLVSMHWLTKAVVHMNLVNQHCSVVENMVKIIAGLPPGEQSTFRDIIVDSLRQARDEVQRARTLAAKAREAAPDDANVRNFYDVVERSYADVFAACRNVGI